MWRTCACRASHRAARSAPLARSRAPTVADERFKNLSPQVEYAAATEGASEGTRASRHAHGARADPISRHGYVAVFLFFLGTRVARDATSSTALRQSCVRVTRETHPLPRPSAADRPSRKANPPRQLAVKGGASATAAAAKENTSTRASALKVRPETTVDGTPFERRTFVERRGYQPSNAFRSRCQRRHRTRLRRA